MATTSEAEQQDANIQPPRKGEIMAQTVDSTARAIDLTKLSFNGQTWQASQKEYLYVTLLNESSSTNIYYYTATDSTVNLDQTLVVAAGGTPSLRTTDPWVLFPLQKEPIRLQRDVDKFLHVKVASGTATLRIGSSSGSTMQQR